ncbi:hypothetical protein F2Q70_00011973 [Brassica cretica]|uniref:Uncharacterized protein n=1 Tax=Brassica cretica TaxID=69181 RepID=A0A8S9LZ53_BRACR|nr:hypothetical protein F2Q70_00011973 [Brassica cretica]
MGKARADLVPKLPVNSIPKYYNPTSYLREYKSLLRKQQGNPTRSCKFERSILKEARSSSIDDNTCSSLDFVQPLSTQTLVPSTDTCPTPSTDDTHLPSTDIVHPTSIDTPSHTSIDTEPLNMVATLILVRDDNGDLHDQEGHLRNAAGQRIDAQGAAIPEYMSSSTRSNKETQLLFSPDPASLERSIRKEARSSSINNNTRSSLDFVQPQSTQTLVPSTNTRSPPSTEDTHLPSTDIVRPTSIDTPSQTSIDTEPRDMVAILILVRDDNGNLHDQEGHLRNAAGRRIYAQGDAIPDGEGIEATRRRFRSGKSDKFRRIALVLIDARLQTSIDVAQSK